MEFNYVLGRYYCNNGQTKVLGGFNKLQDAKDYSDIKETLFMGNGFFFIDSPEGIFVKGYEEYRSNCNKEKWYTQQDIKNDVIPFIRFNYRKQDDEVVSISELLSHNDYIKFSTGSVFKEMEKSSVKEKLANNKAYIESGNNSSPKEVKEKAQPEAEL